MESIEETLRLRGIRHEEQTTVNWYDEKWLKEHILDNKTIMNYFYLSIFYDKAANNEKCIEDLARLKNLVGLEYILDHSIPELGIYHIKKQYRHNDRRVTTLALYYVVAGKIYEAPSINKILTTRMRNFAFNLDASLKYLSKYAKQTD
ncbi:unnamed protein product [Blepharisma stoltei]|uniref:Mediator of RNA polymerase II transcription subunit 6 n=1 Tax=Blepharisma stoltei TaxID=1481888 RepID=A0AAU9JVJ0_9CILI|nr:unnamed protein product [Blepharisma stoltei]